MCCLSNPVCFPLQTQSGLEDVQQKLSSITQVLSDITSDIDELNVTMTQEASKYFILTEAITFIICMDTIFACASTVYTCTHIITALYSFERVPPLIQVSKMSLLPRPLPVQLILLLAPL